MKLYMEALELAESEELDFIRIDLETFDGTAEECFLEVEELISASADDYVIRIHKCYHPEQPKKPCEVRVVNSVSEVEDALNELEKV